jgi:pimeloyl-ACP methyl ester carboxylesterase
VSTVPDTYTFLADDGLELHSAVYAGPSADAPVVLCLHGLMRTGRDFEELAPRLAQRHRVVVPDVRGRGGSARAPDPTSYQIPRYLSDLTPLLTGLGAEQAAIVGTSMGGLMAMAFAATHQARVRRIVLNDIGPEVAPEGLDRIRGYAGRGRAVDTWIEAAQELRGVFGAAWPGLDAARWLALARRCYRLNAEQRLEPDADPRIGDTLRATSGAAPDLWPMWCALVDIPILVVRGAHSDVLSESTVTRMQREKPDLKVCVVNNRGHTPLLDEPESLAALDAFFELPAEI